MYQPDESEVLLEVDGQQAGVIDLAEFLAKLHNKWQPHPGQVPLGRALFYEGYKDIFAECGRNFGKTEVIAYCSTRYGNERPGSENYIFGPAQKQVKEILWASSRIQNIGPDEYIEAINNVEMRVTFSNKSFIKLDGSDNVDSYRGIKPKGLSVYDEFKDMRPEFIDAYDPNRAAFDSPAIYIGTPPEFHNHFVDYAEKARKNHGRGWFYLHAPTSVNPYISKAWLDRKHRELIEAGDEETWLREYEAIFVKGGKRHIFPQFLRYKPKSLSALIPKDMNRWQMVVHFDPATTSTFGVLFSLFNEYTRKLILVDEIYEQLMENMTTRKIWDRVDEILKPWFDKGMRPARVHYGYDEAAAWFMNETTEARPKIWLQPTKKHEFGREEGISQVRDIYNKGNIEVADHLTKYIWEMENYIKDENSKIPKINDHQIDNSFYTLQLLGYDQLEKDLPKPPDPDTLPRFVTPEADADFTFEEFDHL